MSRDDIVVINQPGLEQRTSKSGKVRFVIAMRSQPVLFNLDPKKAGATLTAAIVNHLRQSVKNITTQASPATLRQRKVDAKAYAAGKPWALKQYSGGKTGATPPNQSDRAFNNSGRFANSIVGSASSDGHWRVNVAANRLNPALGNVERIWSRLVSLVPEFANPAKLLESDLVRRAVQKATENMRKVAPETSSPSRALELVRAFVDVAEDFGDLLSG